MEFALGVEPERGRVNEIDGCEDIAAVRFGNSSKISKYCSMQTLITTPSVIFWGAGFPRDPGEGVVARAMEKEVWGIEHNWVSRIILELETRFGVKHMERLVAFILLVSDRSEMS